MNKNLFASPKPSDPMQAAIAVNNANARAYEMTDKHKLVQIAVTGTFGSTFYVTGEEQLRLLTELADKMDAEFVAKVAIYARERGMMKDAPAALVASLAGRLSKRQKLIDVARKEVKGSFSDDVVRETAIFKEAFGRVIDSARMVRGFVQMTRSGRFGRKSLGSAPKKLIRAWLAQLSGDQMFRSAVGESPSLLDIIRLTHAKAANPEQRAVFDYLMDKEPTEGMSETLASYLAFKKDPSRKEIPKVDTRYLSSFKLSTEQWETLAERMRWQTLVMELAALNRKGVFKNKAILEKAVKTIQDVEQMKQSRAMPYQTFKAYKFAEGLPEELMTALLQAAENSASFSIQPIPGRTYIALDTSGSMQSPVMGGHGSMVSTKLRLVDAAAVFAATIARRAEYAVILPFDTKVHAEIGNKFMPILELAEKAARYGGGGTSISCTLEHIADSKKPVDTIYIVSDNESWVDASIGRYFSTQTMIHWARIKGANPNARLICHDLTPNTTTQAKDRADVFNFGGLSDFTLQLVARVAARDLEIGHMVEEVEKIQI